MLVAEADHQPRPMLAKLDRQLHAGLERIEQPAIRQMQQRAQMNAERFAGRLGLGHPHVRPGRKRRRLAVGQVDDADLVAGVDQRGQRAAAGDFHVVRVGADGDDVELRVSGIGHGGCLIGCVDG